MRIHLSTVAAAVIAIGLAIGMPAQAVTTVSSDAYGVSANLNLTLLSALTVNARAGPINAVSGSAGPAYAVTGTVASASENLDLGTSSILGFIGFRQQLDTGVLTSTAQSPFPSSQFGSARAQVDNLGFSLGLDGSITGTTLLSLLGIGADTVVSRSSVTGGATPDAIGFTQIEGLTLSGSLFSPAIIAAAAAGAYVNPGANTVLLGVGVLGQETLKIVLNEQVKTTTSTSAAISTNAIRVIFANYDIVGLGQVSGDIIVAHSQARIIDAVAEVPEPATWVQMIAGFALVGGLTRRSRRRVAA